MEEDEEEEGNNDEDGRKNKQMKDKELEELEKERNTISRSNVLLSGLKHHKDEQVLKGLAVKNQKVLWKKALCVRLLLQKAFSCSNRLPQKPIRSSFCSSDKLVDQAYSDLESSCKETLNIMLDLQEVCVLLSGGGYAQKVAVPAGHALPLTDKIPVPYKRVPYFTYKADPDTVSLHYVLFEPNPGVNDPNTNLTYDNMLYAQVDSVYTAMKAVGRTDVLVNV